MTQEQRTKDNARSHAGVAKRRGQLVPQPCEECGAPDAQMHHEDYSRPRDVIWLCETCHRRGHADGVLHGDLAAYGPPRPAGIRPDPARVAMLFAELAHV